MRGGAEAGGIPAVNCSRRGHAAFRTTVQAGAQHGCAGSRNDGMRKAQPKRTACGMVSVTLAERGLIFCLRTIQTNSGFR